MSQANVAPTPSTLRDLRYTMIPHRVRGVAAGLAALELEARHDRAHPLQLRADGNAVEYDVLLAYTQTVTCVAAIHCRELLNFVGLDGDGAASLRAARIDVDFGIDLFRDQNGTPLTRVPFSAIGHYGEPQTVARAWAATCDFAAQGLALARVDPRLKSGAIAPLLRRAFETVPDMLERWFYARAVLALH